MALFGGIVLGLLIAGAVGFSIGRWFGKDEGREEEALKWKAKGEWKIKEGERHE